MTEPTGKQENVLNAENQIPEVKVSDLKICEIKDQEDGTIHEVKVGDLKICEIKKSSLRMSVDGTNNQPRPPGNSSPPLSSSLDNNNNESRHLGSSNPPSLNRATDESCQNKCQTQSHMSDNDNKQHRSEIPTFKSHGSSNPPLSLSLDNNDESRRNLKISHQSSNSPLSLSRHGSSNSPLSLQNNEYLSRERLLSLKVSLKDLGSGELKRTPRHWRQGKRARAPRHLPEWVRLKLAPDSPRPKRKVIVALSNSPRLETQSRRKPVELLKGTRSGKSIDTGLRSVRKRCPITREAQESIINPPTFLLLVSRFFGL